MGNLVCIVMNTSNQGRPKKAALPRELKSARLEKLCVLKNSRSGYLGYLNQRQKSIELIGFQKFHSTATALLDCTNDWYTNLGRKMFNLVVQIDLKKAFDTVDHQILMRKLEIYGIKHHALALLESYLSNRNKKAN